MTLEEMDAMLKEARERLDLLNKYRRPPKNIFEEDSWEPTLILKAGDAYGHGKVAVKVRIPFGVVQQQLVDAVRAAEREVIRLGGTP